MTPSRSAPSSAASTLSPSPWVAATRSTVGRASAAAGTKHIDVSAGRRDKRLAKSPRKLSGNRSARPAAGLVPVRRSSRPSSSA